jgi:hydroxyethylthiazole kinase
VHCITNDAAHVLSANMLLAVGAVPSLTTARDELGDFVRSADAVLINLGTLDDQRLEAIDLAVEAAASAGIPWLLDPVFCNRSRKRVRLACDMLTRAPAVVRANEREIEAICKQLHASGPEALAESAGTVVVASGPHDLITDGKRRAVVENGHELMSRSTAIGCAGTAVMAAFVACGDDAFDAAVCAMTVIGVAGEIAGEGAAGPGSFVHRLVDAIYCMTADQIRQGARVS